MENSRIQRETLRVEEGVRDRIDLWMLLAGGLCLFAAIVTALIAKY